MLDEDLHNSNVASIHGSMEGRLILFVQEFQDAPNGQPCCWVLISIKSRAAEEPQRAA